MPRTHARSFCRLLRLAPAIGALLLAGCATLSPEEDPVQIRLNDMDARLARIERVVSNQSLIELAQRLDSLQADVRTLRGQIEEMENSSEGLRKQQRDAYADLDRRLAVLEGGSGAARASMGTDAGSSGSSPSSGASVGAGEQAAYLKSFDALKGGNYPAAIDGFKRFLVTWPNGDLAGNAQYWLGEAYYVTGDFESAALAFQRVAQQWPNSRKAPDALVKLGFTQIELKRVAAGRATLNQVVQKYPGTEAARLADDRLRKLGP